MLEQLQSELVRVRSEHYKKQEPGMLVNTIRGPMDDSLLERRDGGHENENEKVRWIEYWLEGELMHRSVDMVLKKMPTMNAETEPAEKR